MLGTACRSLFNLLAQRRFGLSGPEKKAAKENVKRGA